MEWLLAERSEAPEKEQEMILLILALLLINKPAFALTEDEIKNNNLTVQYEDCSKSAMAGNGSVNIAGYQNCRIANALLFIGEEIHSLNK